MSIKIKILLGEVQAINYVFSAIMDKNKPLKG